ncbi:MAG: insulinase family protein [Deltaproteobacteria bacterium]|nr:insulinase family protein [Deltaproteobacteria bacterium]
MTGPLLASLIALAAHSGEVDAPAVRAPAPDRTTQPAAGPERDVAQPPIRQFSFRGIKGYLVERPGLPLVQLELSWNVGGAGDAAGKEGMTSLCVDWLGEGSKRLDKNALENAKADLGARLGIGAGTEAASLSLAVVTTRLEPALALAAELLTEPGLRPADLERLRSQAKAAVVQARGNADGAAGRAWAAAFWGRSHPYGHVAEERTLDAVTAADCAGVHRQLAPEGAELLVVGDVTVEQLVPLLEKAFATWRGKAPARSRVGPPRGLKGAVFFVDIPGAEQSKVIVGHGGPSRDARDYAATTVMTQVFGQGLSSRLVQNLREKNGYTYGASASFGYRRSGSAFTAQSSIRTDATGKALREIHGELLGMTTTPPTDDELRRERDGGLRAFPARFATNAAVLRSVGELLSYRLPLDTWQRWPAELRAVDGAAAAKAVKDRLQPTQKVVVAGDRTKVLPELEALAKEGVFGKDGLVILDADGRPAK